jgi:hypothetical protein
MLNPNDASTFWNNSTGFSRVLIPGGPIDCGIYDGCVLFDTESTTLIGVASCDLPAITDGSYAKLYVDTDSEYNLPDEDCRGIGSDYHPTFVLLIDTGAPSGAYTHMQRHEVGHALGLGDTDTSVTCWTESSVYYPLMKNSSTNCDNYPNNVTATYNEVQGVIDRNDWY